VKVKLNQVLMMEDIEVYQSRCGEGEVEPSFDDGGQPSPSNTTRVSQIQVILLEYPE
jgi:hypothetical protein